MSMPSTAGVPAADALADGDAIARLLASLPLSASLRTRRSVEYLRWRYTGLPALAYRVMIGPGGIDDGLVVFRQRRRGPATEIAVAEVIVPGDDPRQRARMLRRVARQAGGDYALVLGRGTTIATAGYVPLPRQGPILTFRRLHRPSAPPLAAWNLTLGDVELF
jgi:hypothetical protein